MFSLKTISRLLKPSRNGRYLNAKPHLPMCRNSNLPTSKTFRLMQHVAPPRYFTTSSTFYATHTIPPKEAQPESEPETKTDQWISILENTTSAPWLFSLPPDNEQKLKLAYTLLFQIVLYLTRPAEAEQFIMDFSTADASPESEIGRARTAVGVIIRATVHQMASVPFNSPLRSDHADIFDIFGALHAMHDMYLFDNISTLETWSEFWTRAQPVVLELGMKLDEKGFGLTEDDMRGLESAGEKAAGKA